MGSVYVLCFVLGFRGSYTEARGVFLFKEPFGGIQGCVIGVRIRSYSLPKQPNEGGWIVSGLWLAATRMHASSPLKHSEGCMPPNKG